MSGKILILLSVLAAGMFGKEVPHFSVLRESLDHVPRKLWGRWLGNRGYDASRFTTYQKPDSQGLRMVGKWGRGPSVEVTGQDTLVALTLGSEVALLSFADPDNPRVLSEIQLDYLPSQSALQDTLLFTCGNGLEIWSIADPTQPEHVTVIPRAVGDFSLQDTLLYFVSQDTFWVYSVANPEDPYSLGFCRDSGYVATSAGSTVVLIQPHDVLGFVDVTDPSAPVQVGTWPGWARSAAARGSLCCAAFTDVSQPERTWLLTLDIADPANPRQLGRVDSVCGHDIFLVDSLAFVSGRNDAYGEMRIVDISDSTNPRRLGTCGVWNDNWGVWANLDMQKALIATEPSGLALVDIADANAPFVDSCILTADQAVDIWMDGDRAYVANHRAGMRVLDVSDPMRPAEVGGFDSLHGVIEAVAARDSFAFTGWWATPYFRSFDVSDPRYPRPAGGGLVQTIPEDMVLHDTLVYLVGRLRFNVVNVARPREPVLVGSCNIQDGVWGLVVQDTLAFVSGVSLYIVNVADPASPYVVSTSGRPSVGVAVRDTFAYVPSFETLFVYSVADPALPRVLSTTPTGRAWDVVLGDTLLFIGTNVGVEAYDVGNPAEPRRVASASAPYGNRRLCYVGGYLYGAFWDAGVAVYETTTSGIAERVATSPSSSRRISAVPNPASDRVRVIGAGETARVVAYDAAGRAVGVETARSKGGDIELNVAGLEPGVYFVEVVENKRIEVLRIVRP